MDNQQNVNRILSSYNTACMEQVALPDQTSWNRFNNTKNIAEDVLGHIEWPNESYGYCRCPGHGDHTAPTSKWDCLVFAKPVPEVHCLHPECKASVNQCNQALYKALNENAGTDSRRQRPIANRGQKYREEMLGKRTHIYSQRHQIHENHRWTLADMQSQSPVGLHDNKKEHWRWIVGMYGEQDNLWIGEKYDSGENRGYGHFQRRDVWLAAYDGVSYPYICPTAFKKGSLSRSVQNMTVQRFLVVEAEELGVDGSGAIFKFIDSRMDMPILAVVDTGLDSLQCWFSYPNGDGAIKDLKIILPVLGCNPQIFFPSQHVCLPGFFREDTEQLQSLVYLNRRSVTTSRW